VTDERLRDLVRAHARPADGHPSEDEFARVFLAEANPFERARLMDHVARCAECSYVYRALRELEDAARAADPSLPASGRKPSTPALAWGGFGALAAAAALAVAVLRPSAPPAAIAPPQDATRARPEAVVTPAPGAPVGSLSTRPAEFRWTPAADAQGYRVRLFSDAGELLWTSDDVREARAAFPADLALPGGTYYWQVLTVPTWSTMESDLVPSEQVRFDFTPR
jgi:hypothetical protein